MKNENDSILQWVGDADAWRLFAFYSTNISRLMPHIPLVRHVDLYRETIQLKQRNGDIHACRRHILRMNTPPPVKSKLPRPAIWAVFHTGPYNFVCGWLMLQQIPFTLLVSGDVMSQHAVVYKTLYKTLTGKPADTSVFNLVDASKPKSLIHMRAALRNGHQLVAYLDGNAGTNRQPQLLIDFFGQKMGVKTGVAFLAYLMNCPVYPLSCYWSDGEAQWKTSPAIQKQRGETREVFIQRCISSCYQHLQRAVKQHTSQWEGWLYVHRDLLPTVVVETSTGISGKNAHFLHDYMPFVWNGHGFLIRRSDGAIHPIPRDTYDRVWQCARAFYKKLYLC